MPLAQGISFANVVRGRPGGRAWMLEDHPRGGWSGRNWTGPWWGIRTPEWHLLEWHGTQLYDVRDDPLERVDVSQFHAFDVARLKQLGRHLVSP